MDLLELLRKASAGELQVGSSGLGDGLVSFGT